jgi:magnesium-transporting ATPase (P-type)
MPEGKEPKVALYPAWTKTATEVAADLGVDLSFGLSNEEVEHRRSQHGFNELVKEPGTPWWKLIAQQFDDMLVKVRAGRGAAKIKTSPWSVLEGWPMH